MVSCHTAVEPLTEITDKFRHEQEEGHVISVVRELWLSTTVSDASYEFVLCGTGNGGRISDEGVRNNKDSFITNLTVESQNIRRAEVRNSNSLLKYAFVCVRAFPVRSDLLKPFSPGRYE
jgi:hypothetical protein